MPCSGPRRPGVDRRLRRLSTARRTRVSSGRFRTTIDDVALVQGLREEKGWIGMHVQFLIDSRTARSDKLLVGRTVLPPGARHEKHAHPNCDEFLVVLSGCGEIYTDAGRESAMAGDVIFTPRGYFHGFDNTGEEDVLLIWGWSGAG